MLCEKCKQREASIVLTEVVNGVRTEHNLCRHCASQLERNQFLEMDFPFMKLLSNILGIESDSESLHFEQLEKLSCPVCGTTYGDFVKNSSFGCADCYETFGLLIENNIKKMQGSSMHVGKKPKFQYAMEAQTEENPQNEPQKMKVQISKEEQIELLRARIKEAISEEDYEKAAHYRDEIKALTEGVAEHE